MTSERTREAQAITLGAAFILMGVMLACPMSLIFVERGGWTLGSSACLASTVITGGFAMAVMARAQKLRAGESILSGRFGLAIAVVALVLASTVEVLLLWGLVGGHLHHVGRTFAGVLTLPLGIAYLARRIYQNVTGRDAPLSG